MESRTGISRSTQDKPHANMASSNQPRLCDKGNNPRQFVSKIRKKKPELALPKTSKLESNRAQLRRDDDKLREMLSKAGIKRSKRAKLNSNMGKSRHAMLCRNIGKPIVARSKTGNKKSGFVTEKTGDAAPKQA